MQERSLFYIWYEREKRNVSLLTLLDDIFRETREQSHGQVFPAIILECPERHR